MRGFRSPFSLVLALLVLMAPAGAVAQSDTCEAVLRAGLFNETLTTDHEVVARFFHRLECRSDWSTHSEAIDAGAGATVPIYGVLVTGTGTYTSEQRSAFRSAQCADVDSSLDYRHALLDFRRVVSSEVVTAWSACMERRAIGGPGLVCEVLAADSHQVTIGLGYHIAGQTADAHVSGVRLTHGTSTSLVPEARVAQASERSGLSAFVIERERTATAVPQLTFSLTVALADVAAVDCNGSVPAIRLRHRGSRRVSGSVSAPAAIYADTLTIAAGTRIRVPDGQTLVIEARRLVVGADATIDATGTQGANATTPGAPSTQTVTVCNICCDDRARECGAWADGHGDHGGPGNPGSDGGPGGNVIIRYQEYEGEQLSVSVAGGAGGAGSAGGAGAVIQYRTDNGVTTCGHCVSGPPGRTGATGARGSSVMDDALDLP